MSVRADGVLVARPLFQEAGDGSIPISALWFRPISRARFRVLNARWHSTRPLIGAINTMRVCFGAWHDGCCYAVAAWSNPVGRSLPQHAWAELRRFAIAPDAPRNTGSRMLAWMAREMFRRYPQLQKLISYQDHATHDGTIYRAAGWKEVIVEPWGGGWANREDGLRTAKRSRHKSRWEKDRT